MDVVLRRALVTLFKWEQTWARLERDILNVYEEGLALLGEGRVPGLLSKVDE